MGSGLSSSPPGKPRSRTIAFNMARPAYIPAHIPAGPAPTITTSYSKVAAKCSSLRQWSDTGTRTWRQFITGVQWGGVFARSDAYVPPAIDDDRLAGDVVRFEEEDDGRAHIGGAAGSRQGRRLAKALIGFGGPVFGKQHGAWSDAVDADFRRENAGERAGHVHDPRFGDAMRDVRRPTLERGEVGDVDDGARRLAKVGCRRLRHEER